MARLQPGARPSTAGARAATAALVTAVVAGALWSFGAVAYAGGVRGTAQSSQYQYDGTRPGWGCGDKNHVHTGPPGRQYGTTPPPGCVQYGRR